MAYNVLPFTYLAPQTAVSSAGQQTAYVSDQYDSFTVSADNLAGSETVQLRVIAGTTLKQVTDIYGTAINLSSTISAVALEGGPQYVFIKDVTAGLCGIYTNPKLT